MNKELLTEFFSEDAELLSKYHILAPASAEICAERTWTDLEKSKCSLHLIEKNNEIIGYYGIEGDAFLTGFFLRPQFRTKEIIEVFWSKVDSHFKKDYFIGLYKKNERASKFLDRKTNTKYEVGEDVVFYKVMR